MKTCCLTEGRLRAAANVDRKTLLGLLDGSRWPQEETRLRIETVLGWSAGSIQDLRDGGEPTLLDVSPESALELATDDELLGEVRRRLALVYSSPYGALATHEPQPPDWGHGIRPRSALENPRVRGDKKSG